MCGPHFCSMKITQDVREYADSLGMAPEQALSRGLEEKAAEFNQAGQNLHVPAAGQNLNVRTGASDGGE